MNWIELLIPIVTVLGVFIANAARELVREIHAEVKDFHERLLAIESKRIS